MSWIPFSIASDNHGDMGDPVAIKAFLNFCDEFKPKIRIHLGDAIDYRGIRRGASPEDKYESMQADYDDGTQFLRDYGANVWLWGNHDDRPNLMAENTNGVMRDYAARINQDMLDFAKDQKCQVLPYDVAKGVYELGKVNSGGVRCVHGTSAGIHALRAEVAAYHRVIHGHVHTRAHTVGSTYDPSEGYTCPCLCRLDMTYSKAWKASLRHCHGWLFGIMNNRTGAVVINEARSIDGKFVYSSGFNV